MKSELGWILDNFYPYIANEIESYIPIYKKIPSFAQKLTGKVFIFCSKILYKKINFFFLKKILSSTGFDWCH